MKNETEQMQKQTEITGPRPLLDENGVPAFPGYCRKNYYIYNKENIRHLRGRIKEWDFYLITDGRYKVELNFFNISAVAALTASVLDLKTGKHYTDLMMEPSGPDRFQLSPAADRPFTFSYHRLGRSARFVTGTNSHTLHFKGMAKGKPFEIHIRGHRLPDQESLTMLTPFPQKYCFFHTQKLNCIAAKGKIRIGRKIIRLDPEKAFMAVDWARGIWPYKSMWYWSNASTQIDGKRFGLELTWGFGDESNATETALFYDGKCHKIGAVSLLEDPQKAGWKKPWHFLSKDGRLALTLTPIRHERIGLVFAGLLGHRSDQVFGYYNGYVVLDDGTRLEIRNMFAFAEKVKNRW